MSQMICSICHRYGIYWKNLGGLAPYTFCPRCNNTKCQQPEIREQEESEK